MGNFVDLKIVLLFQLATRGSGLFHIVTSVFNLYEFFVCFGRDHFEWIVTCQQFSKSSLIVDIFGSSLRISLSIFVVFPCT